MKSLTKLLVAGVTLVGLTFGQQYQAKNTDKINVFVQPNDSTLAYYGSLDVNKGNVLNWDDYNKMVAEAPQIDEADLNGNEIPSDPQDVQIAADYFNGIIEYLPAQWNKLPTREKRIDWLDKMLAIDQTDTITYVPYDPTGDFFISGNFGVQTYINFYGIKFKNQEEKDLAATKYNIENNCRFNITVYTAGISTPNFSHGLNGSWVGDNISNIYDIVYPDQISGRDPVNDLYFLGENWFVSGIPSNSQLVVDKPAEPSKNSQGKVTFLLESLVDFRSSDDAVLNLYYLNPNLIETREQAMDADYPLLTITTPQQDSTYKTSRTPLNFTVTDVHFDRIGYSLNNADTTWLTIAENSFDIESIEGKNIILFIAEDKAGNQTLEEIRYYGDENYVGIEYAFLIPLNFKLYQNYPNPFNPSTTIQFDIPSGVIAIPIFREKQSQTKEITSSYQNIGTSRNDNVILIVYDITGKEIATLIDNINTSGTYSIEWNASGYPSGIYLYQLQNNFGVLATKKMLLMK